MRDGTKISYSGKCQNYEGGIDIDFASDDEIDDDDDD